MIFRNDRFSDSTLLVPLGLFLIALSQGLRRGLYFFAAPRRPANKNARILSDAGTVILEQAVT